GGKHAEKVLDYLQSVKKLELKPVPFLSKPARRPGSPGDRGRPPQARPTSGATNGGAAAAPVPPRAGRGGWRLGRFWDWTAVHLEDTGSHHQQTSYGERTADSPEQTSNPRNDLGPGGVPLPQNNNTPRWGGSQPSPLSPAAQAAWRACPGPAGSWSRRRP